MESERWWNAPNLLTISRMILAPFVVRAIVAERPRLALWLIVIAALTDLLDGWAARATGATSRIGERLDPVADKLLMSGAFIGLAWAGIVPLWLVAVTFGRDLVLILASLVVIAFTAYRNLRPSLLGKISTLCQVITAGTFIGAEALGANLPAKVENFLIWLTAALACASGAQYLWRGARAMAHR